MSQPEIFRRCSSCGASCRTGELFCAQCGNALVTQAIPPSSTTAEQSVGAGEHDLETKANTVPEVPTAGEAAQQPRSATRAAMEGRMKPGIDKLRRVSSVVLDEAAFDPGVRFILVVGVLFLLFLVLLLLSKWIG